MKAYNVFMTLLLIIACSILVYQNLSLKTKLDKTHIELASKESMFLKGSNAALDTVNKILDNTLKRQEIARLSIAFAKNTAALKAAKTDTISYIISPSIINDNENK
jgi:hypothetical protein